MAKGFTPPKNSKKTTVSIEALESELRRRYVEGDNPARLEEIKAHLDYIFYGVIKKC